MTSFTFHSWILVERDLDADEELWVAHALDFDVLSNGSTPQEAYDSIREAMAMALLDDLNSGLNPNDRPKATSEDWERLWRLIETGEKVNSVSRQAVNDLTRTAGPGARVQLATQIALAFRSVNDHVAPDPVPLQLEGRLSFAAAV